ncbi:MAG: hypothetical protein EXR71_06345 [Myxococcales bacterium]|nr:hypothetical protein [Myxococcales bacterium]
MMLLLACLAPRPGSEPNSASRAAESWAAAAVRVPDTARGGPAVAGGASPLPPFLGVSRASARYVGVRACSPCHPAATATWSASAHAHARTTLLQQKKGYDPECLRCHVTGLGHPGGWSGEADTERGQVGCESCHGPGSDHVRAPAAAYGALPADGSACIACHTYDNSPDFGWEHYWPSVRHPG